MRNKVVTDLIVSKEEDEWFPNDASLHQQLADVVAPLVLPVHPRYLDLTTHKFFLY